jgi:hypothetical protein
MNTNEDMVYMKILVFVKIYNIVVQTFSFEIILSYKMI